MCLVVKFLFTSASFHSTPPTTFPDHLRGLYHTSVLLCPLFSRFFLAFSFFLYVSEYNLRYQPSCFLQCISNTSPKPFRVSLIHLWSPSMYSDTLCTELHHCTIPHCPLHMHCCWFVCLLLALVLLLFVCLFTLASVN